MAVPLRCNSCGGQMKAPERLIGKIVRCPRCKARIRVKRPDVPPSEPTDEVSAQELLAEIRGGKKVEPAVQQQTAGASAPAVPSTASRLLLRAMAAILVVGLVIALVVGGMHYYSRVRSQKRQRSLETKQSLSARLPAIEKDFETAKKYFSQAQYADAKDMLDLVTKSVDALLSDVIHAISQIEGEKGAEFFEPLRDRLVELKAEASDILHSEEIIYGGKGYVLFEGKWVAPEEKKRIEDKRFAEEQRKKGLVFHNGQWMTPDEQNLALGLVKFEGKWITKEERERRLKEKARGLADGARRVFRRGPTRRISFDPKQTEWVLDDFEEGNAWYAEGGWADRCEVTIREVNASKMLCISYTPGPRKKAAVGRNIGADLSSRSLLTVDIFSQSEKPADIALAVFADRYYESQPVTVRPGLNLGVSFALKEPCYKCDIDNWKSFTHPIKSPEKVGRIMFLIYSESPVNIALDNIKLIAR